MDAHRARVRHNHIGLAALLGLYVVRSSVVVESHPKGLGYGDSAINDAVRSNSSAHRQPAAGTAPDERTLE